MIYEKIGVRNWEVKWTEVKRTQLGIEKIDICEGYQKMIWKTEFLIS
tara:strand:+ start:270 stop:410 length:141 start_codon:yes stop_codon:yes gene_type:complete